MEQKSTDTTQRLWDYLYKVRIPYMRSRTIEDIRQHGTVVSGIASYDNDIDNQLLTTMLSISSMVDYFREGVPIRVVDHSDCKRIYEDISQHIYSWKSRLEHGINIGDAPIDDLIDLDRFANTVYEHAKYQFTKDTANSIFAQHLGTIQRINSSNFFSKPLTTSTGNTEDGIVRINAEEKIEDRDSLGEFFKSRASFIRRY